MRSARLISVVCLISCAFVALAADSIGDVRSLYDGKLRPDIQVNTFRHIDRLFPTHVVRHGTSVLSLPPSPTPIKDLEFTSNGKKWDLPDYLSMNRVSGLLVLKDGKVALEDYELGNTPNDRWVSWSMVKSICSTLAAAALKDGYISSLDDPLTKYMPELRGTSYEGTSVRNVLQMASGVKWDETYTDPNSDRRHMLELQIAEKPGEIVKYMSGLPRVGPPGSVWKYSTGETQMIGALLRAAVKKPLAQYLSEKIWSKAGMEDDATWWLESPDGLEVGGSGLSARLRDYGRFALFVLNGGKIGDEQVVPPGWFEEAGSSKVVGGKPVDYGYMWFTFGPNAPAVHQGAFRVTGIFGQGIYVNPREHVAIVLWSARSKPSGQSAINDVDFFAAVTNALHR